MGPEDMLNIWAGLLTWILAWVALGCATQLLVICSHTSHRSGTRGNGQKLSGTGNLLSWPGGALEWA